MEKLRKHLKTNFIHFTLCEKNAFPEKFIFLPTLGSEKKTLEETRILFNPHTNRKKNIVEHFSVF